MLLSISEIIKKAASFSNDEEKIAYLQLNNNIALRKVLRFGYDPKVELLISREEITWKKQYPHGVEGMLYKEARRLRIFVKGTEYDSLDQVKRRMLFVSLLEDLNDNDADLLYTFLAKKGIKGLTFDHVKAAFPEDYK